MRFLNLLLVLVLSASVANALEFTERTEYMKVKRAAFDIEFNADRTGVASRTYAFEVDIIKDLPSALYYRVEAENPQDPAKPIVSSGQVQQADKHFSAVGLPVVGAQPRQVYNVTIKLCEDEQCSKVVDGLKHRFRCLI